MGDMMENILEFIKADIDDNDFNRRTEDIRLVNSEARETNSKLDKILGILSKR